jgi:hypothetical protein
MYNFMVGALEPRSDKCDNCHEQHESCENGENCFHNNNLCKHGFCGECCGCNFHEVMP